MQIKPQASNVYAAISNAKKAQSAPPENAIYSLNGIASAANPTASEMIESAKPFNAFFILIIKTSLIANSL